MRNAEHSQTDFDRLQQVVGEGFHLFSEERQTLISCYRGRNRAALAATVAIRMQNKLDVRGAVQAVSEGRGHVLSNVTFVKRLAEYSLAQPDLCRNVHLMRSSVTYQHPRLETFVKEYRAKALAMVGEETLKEAEEARRLRDGEVHRVTLTALFEKRTDDKPFNTFAKFAVAAMDLDGPIVKDVGKVEKDGGVAIFLVLSWPGLMDLREGFGLKSDYFHLHVTIGYYPEDIHAVTKDERTIVDMTACFRLTLLRPAASKLPQRRRESERKRERDEL